MNTLDPEHSTPDNILAIYLLINEQWQMSPGKIASQAFQACQLLLAAVARGECSPEQAEMLAEWQSSGTRTITKFAPTEELFTRCCQELAGVTLIDEGLTEGTRGATCFATWPLRRGELPRMLRHKRIRLQPSCTGVLAEKVS